MTDPRIPLIVLLGPTAVGKTELSLQLAEMFNGEIVSADSRLFYRGMDIGTAKPGLAERARVPHHLIDVAEPTETWSLSVFQQAAQSAIADIHKRGKLPILVGGTGQYIEAVTHGWNPPAAPPNPALRQVLEGLARQHSTQWLHDKLNIIDPKAAANMDHRNLRRTVRALEVILTTGRLFSTQREKGPSPYRLIKIGLKRPRHELYQRVDQRIEQMFADGLLEETKRLLAQGCTPQTPSMSAIGYRECVAVLSGDMTIEEAITEMKRLTRIFVRRQGNWFKEDDLSIHWFLAGTVSGQEIANSVTKALSLSQPE